MVRDDLYITIPSFFRCPISLDVMKSPVSLSTGVTYDRASIQRWLDTGHDTCPATMQVLPDKQFIPNHTLHRLIQIWASQTQPQPQARTQPDSLSCHQALALIKTMADSSEHYRFFDSMVKLLCFVSESEENQRFLAENDAFLDLIFGLISDPENDPGSDLLEVGVKILEMIPLKRTAVEIQKTHPGFLMGLARILKTARPDSVAAVAAVLEAISPDPDSKRVVFDTNELLPELLQALLIPPPAGAAVAAALCALISLSAPRRNKARLLRAGGVRVLTELLKSVDNHNSSSNTNPNSNIVTTRSSSMSITELALTQLEMLAGSAEGRAAITEDPTTVSRVVQKMMKVSATANEHAVSLLWSLCYLFRDQKAKEAVMRSNGGLTKILLLMQSNCSPAVKRMCCDLLRIFRVNSKSCLSSYDTKTTHIMPC